MTAFVSFARTTSRSSLSGGLTPMFSIDTTFNDFLSSLSLIEREQFPFATAKTLTQVAKIEQGRAQKLTRTVFRLHTEWIPNSIRITPAKKQDMKMLHQTEAVVRTDARIAFMVLQETGGEKTPSKSSLSIPQINLLLAPAVKTGTGKIANKYKPKSLLHGRSKDLPAFIAKGMIMMRTGKKRYPLVVLYRFTPRAHIKPKWHFGESIIIHAKEIMPQMFDTNLSEAVNSAFKKPGM